MNSKGTLTSKVLVVVIMVLTLALTLNSAQAQKPVPQNGAAIQATVETAFTYQGRLTDNDSPADGAYDLVFSLYDAPSGGTQVGVPVTKEDTSVRGGLFTVQLDFGNVFNGTALWVQVGVRPGESSDNYTALSPLQPLTAAPYALSLRPGATMTGFSGDVLALVNRHTSGSSAALRATSHTPSGYGVVGNAVAETGGNTGVAGFSASSTGIGVGGYANASSGGAIGVKGVSNSSEGTGGYFVNNGNNGVALYALAGGAGRDKATLQVANLEPDAGMAAYLSNQSNFHNTHIQNTGSGGILYLQNGGTDANGTGGGDFITALNSDTTDVQFRVASNGDVRSDGSFNTPAADFAEMLPAVDGLTPGEVLVIGLDGKLTRSTQAYQRTVVGVYSTQPGFVGGAAMDGDTAGRVPLAVMGVVPVKASAENGAILPGDMLTASATPGHAMRAATDAPVGSVIGKALEGLDKDTGVILMLVMHQ